MKHSLKFLPLILVAGFILFACSRPIEKKLAGTWKVEDVQIQTSLQIDPAILEDSEESQKSISYELLEDYTAKIHAGFSTFEGNWIYNEQEKSVFMVFTGTFDTILLGRYENEKLVNEDNSDDFQIKTIFGKQED